MAKSALTNGYEIVTVGQGRELKGYTLTKNQFEVLGTVILTQLRKQNTLLPHVERIFKDGKIRLEGFDAALLIEELAILIQIMTLPEILQDKLALMVTHLRLQVDAEAVAEIAVCL